LRRKKQSWSSKHLSFPHVFSGNPGFEEFWMPVFTGMTVKAERLLHALDRRL